MLILHYQMPQVTLPRLSAEALYQGNLSPVFDNRAPYVMYYYGYFLYLH